MERVADYIINRLYEQGVEHIFMVTGRGVLYLSDAVAKHPTVVGISTHHEQAAAFAALSYAQANEKMGACLVSTGCAATNAITGLLCAWQDNVPCVFISGQHKLHETSRYTNVPIRTYGSQEADIISLVEPISKYATMITNPNKITYELDKAIYLAHEGRKGPVWIDVPVDVQNMRIEPSELERFVPMETPNRDLSSDDISYVIEALAAASRPVLLIGSGIRSAGAIDGLETFLEKNPMPVAFSSSAADIYGASNPLSMGVVASIGGTRCGNFTVQNADVLLVIGCRLSPQLTGSEYEKFARDAKIIVVDLDPVEHSKNTVRIDKLIISDAKLFIEALLLESLPRFSEDWLNRCLHWKAVFPKCEEKYKSSAKIDLYEVADCISETLGDDCILMSDSGLSELLMPSTVSFKRGQRCIHSPNQGSMGFALPGAIGAYFATQRQIVAVIGDGSMMMNLQELQTIAHHKIPIKIILINNNAYSVIRTRQAEQFRSRTIGTDESNGVSCPDYEKVATCFGLSYVKIEDRSQLKEELMTVYSMQTPTLCEIYCEEEQEYLHSSYTQNAQRRLVRRPLEDQYPYMDRALFLSEMIVDPIDQ